MSNKDFNEFYNILLNMDEDELHNTVLGMAKIVMEEEKKKAEIKKQEERLNDLRRERVM